MLQNVLGPSGGDEHLYSVTFTILNIYDFLSLPQIPSSFSSANGKQILLFHYDEVWASTNLFHSVSQISMMNDLVVPVECS